MLNHRVYIRDPGDEWVVFVHGAGGSSAIWHKQLRDFRAHFNVLLVDLRGHGGSAGGGEGHHAYTFEGVGAEIVDVMDHRGVDAAHFVGISLGTILIRTVAETAPDRVKSMVLGGAITRLDLRSRVLVTLGTAVRRFVPYMWMYRLFAWIIMPRRRHRESRLLFVREARRLAQSEFLRWWRLADEVNPLLRAFEGKSVPVPTLYVMGDEDHMFLPAVRQLVTHGGGQIQVVEGSGHVVNVDRADDFNAISIGFIRAARPAS